MKIGNFTLAYIVFTVTNAAEAMLIMLIYYLSNIKTPNNPVVFLMINAISILVAFYIALSVYGINRKPASSFLVSFIAYLTIYILGSFVLTGSFIPITEMYGLIPTIVSIEMFILGLVIFYLALSIYETLANKRQGKAMAENALHKQRYFTTRVKAAIFVFALIIIYSAYFVTFSNPDAAYTVPLACGGYNLFFCKNLTINSDNTVSFALQNIEGTLYNVSFECVEGSGNTTIINTYWTNAMSLDHYKNNTLKFNSSWVNITGLSCYTFVSGNPVPVKLKSNNFGGTVWIRYAIIENASPSILLKAAPIQVYH